MKSIRLELNVAEETDTLEVNINDRPTNSILQGGDNLVFAIEGLGSVNSCKVYTTGASFRWSIYL